MSGLLLEFVQWITNSGRNSSTGRASASSSCSFPFDTADHLVVSKAHLADGSRGVGKLQVSQWSFCGPGLGKKFVPFQWLYRVVSVDVVVLVVVVFVVIGSSSSSSSGSPVVALVLFLFSDVIGSIVRAQPHLLQPVVHVECDVHHKGVFSSASMSCLWTSIGFGIRSWWLRLRCDCLRCNAVVVAVAVVVVAVAAAAAEKRIVCCNVRRSSRGTV